MTGFAIGAVVALLVVAILACLAARAVILQLHRRLDRIVDAQAARSDLARLEAEASAARNDIAALLQKSTVQTQQIAAIRRDLARLYFAARSANVLANRNVIDHLAALGAAQVPPPTLSYGFQAATRALTPQVTRRGCGRTVVCTLALGEAFRAKVQPVLDSHRAYAEARGLSYAILSDPPAWIDRPPPWMKIPLIQDLFQRGFERVVYLDADALVTNPDFDVEAVFGVPTANGGLTLTEDEAGINCGVMFLEDGPALRRLLDLVWLFDADITHGTWEQFALKSLMSMSAATSRSKATPGGSTASPPSAPASIAPWTAASGSLAISSATSPASAHRISKT
jgi:hypothetical protein